MYGAECWTVGKKEEEMLDKTKMNVRRSKGVALRDKIKSVGNRKELGMNLGSIKIEQSTKMWSRWERA